MPDFITLTCPSCGGKLQVTQDIDRFACSFCGTEHIVRRSGGIVALTPVEETLIHVKTGVDKTASELAIRRLREEIQILEKERYRIINDPRYQVTSGLGLFLFILGIISILMGLFFLLVTNDGSSLLYCGIPGILILLFAYFSDKDNPFKSAKLKRDQQSLLGYVNAQTSKKRAELAHHEEVVSKGVLPERRP